MCSCWTVCQTTDPAHIQFAYDNAKKNPTKYSIGANVHLECCGSLQGTVLRFLTHLYFAQRCKYIYSMCPVYSYEIIKKMRTIQGTRW